MVAWPTPLHKGLHHSWAAATGEPLRSGNFKTWEQGSIWSPLSPQPDTPAKAGAFIEERERGPA
jgi:hypothetical protein